MLHLLDDLCSTPSIIPLPRKWLFLCIPLARGTSLAKWLWMFTLSTIWLAALEMWFCFCYYIMLKVGEWVHSGKLLTSGEKSKPNPSPLSSEIYPRVTIFGLQSCAWQLMVLFRFVCMQFRKVLCVHSGYSASSGVWHEKCILLGLFL